MWVVTTRIQSWHASADGHAVRSGFLAGMRPARG